MKAIIAIIIGAIGLLLSTCGLFFLAFSFGGSGGGVVAIALPAALAGGLLLWGAVALWMSWRKSKKVAATKPLGNDAAPPH